MMGSIKLSEVKAILDEAFARESETSTQWLERRIRELEKDRAKGKATETTETLESLLRVLKGATKKKRRSQRKAKTSH